LQLIIILLIFALLLCITYSPLLGDLQFVSELGLLFVDFTT